jgi:GH24 family phage-related lysozyme (muramidase)
MKFDGREEYVTAIQTALNLKPDGVDGKITWQAIHDRILGVKTLPKLEVANSNFSFSDKAYKLIVKYEVGGGSEYYTKCLERPTYPGGASGVTIGIGYDLGYNTLKQFEDDWHNLLDANDYNKLTLHIGKKADKAKAAISSLRDIRVKWAAAESVFKTSTLPRFIVETKRAFPGSDKLHPDAFGALVSLVFNRGGSVVGSSRQEMLNIRDAISNKIYTVNTYLYIAHQILEMKRLWIGKGLDGLLVRRNEESALVKACS